MKVAVINFSGNVGKTTVARHLLAPRLDNPAEISVESINADGPDGEALRGRQFGQLHEMLSLADSAVVDIGSSNVEDFIGQMAQFEGSHDEFDYFVVPVSPKDKPQRDTISTINALSDVRVPPSKIKLLFNLVEIGQDPRQVFPALFAYHEGRRNFTINPAAAIHENEIFERLRGIGKTIEELLADQTDYRAKIKETDEQEEKRLFARLIATKRLASGITREFGSVFKALF